MAKGGSAAAVQERSVSYTQRFQAGKDLTEEFVDRVGSILSRGSQVLSDTMSTIKGAIADRSLHFPSRKESQDPLQPPAASSSAKSPSSTRGQGGDNPFLDQIDATRRFIAKKTSKMEFGKAHPWLPVAFAMLENEGALVEEKATALRLLSSLSRHSSQVSMASFSSNLPPCCSIHVPMLPGFASVAVDSECVAFQCIFQGA